MGRFQFSLRMMLAAVAVVGIGAALWVAEPSWQVGLVEAVFVTWLIALPLMFIGRSSGAARAWWIGIAVESIFATVSHAVAIYSAFSIWGNISDLQLQSQPTSFHWFGLRMAELFHPLIASWALAPAVGFLCYATHWLFVRPPVSNE